MPGEPLQGVAPVTTTHETEPTIPTVTASKLFFSLKKRGQPQSDSSSSSSSSPPHSLPWHTYEITRIQQELQTTNAGLSNDEAFSRLHLYGRNQLTPPYKAGFLRKLWAQINNILIYILIISSVISAILQEWADLALIIAVIVINVMIGMVQEGRAEKAAEAIKAMLSPRATVVRNEGARTSVDAALLVPGDVVFVQSGDRAPADARMFMTSNLHVQESMLTGESLPVAKDTSISIAESALGDRKGMIFAGSTIQQGQGLGIVVATGDKTEIGRIGALVAQTEDQPTQLQIQLEIFGRIVAVATILIAVSAYLIIRFARDLSNNEAFLSAVGIAVAIIPEGLPAVVTITLAIGVQHMAAHKAIVRQLPAVETLGSVTVICSDKTGTLTKNEMTAVAVIIPDNGDDGHGEADGDESARGDVAEMTNTLAHVARDKSRYIAVTGVGYDPSGGTLKEVPWSPRRRLRQRAGGPLKEKAPAFEEPALLVEPDTRIKEFLAEVLLSGILCNDGGLTEPSSFSTDINSGEEHRGTPPHASSSSSSSLASSTPVVPARKETTNSYPIDHESVSTYSSTAKAAAPWSISGDPTDVALLTLALKTGTLPSLSAINKEYPRISGIPFESDYKFQVSINPSVPISATTAIDTREEQEGVVASGIEDKLPKHRLVAHIKGAPERLIPRCVSQLLPSTTSSSSTRIAPCDAAFWLQQSSSLSRRGLRVLALCRLDDLAPLISSTSSSLPGASEGSSATASSTPTITVADINEGPPRLLFLCLVAILDPPREECITAIREAKSAGITVKMITGDHPDTAAAIGEMLGLVAGASARPQSTIHPSAPTTTSPFSSVSLLPPPPLPPIQPSLHKSYDQAVDTGHQNTDVRVSSIVSPLSSSSMTTSNATTIIPVVPSLPSDAENHRVSSSSANVNVNVNASSSNSSSNSNGSTSLSSSTSPPSSTLSLPIGPTEVHTGPEIDAMSDADLAPIVLRCNIFARANPETKIRIVRALQKHGHIVSMTGDGVNDAPALKAANIGVAMGITGTDVSKEAAKMVLADDNFATIVQAVKEGRAVWDNLQKILLVSLPTNLAQGLSIFFAYVVNTGTSPLTAMQVLWVNMLASVTIGVVLAFEPPEPNIMQRRPRRPGKRLLGKFILWRVLFVTTLLVVAVIGNFWWSLQIDAYSVERSRTVALNTLVMAQLFYAVSCRFLTRTAFQKAIFQNNYYFWVGVGVTIALQMLLTYTPGIQGIFGTAFMNGLDWLRAIGLGACIFVLVEIEKWIGPKYIVPRILPVLRVLRGFCIRLAVIPSFPARRIMWKRKRGAAAEEASATAMVKTEAPAALAASAAPAAPSNLSSFPSIPQPVPGHPLPIPSSLIRDEACSSSTPIAFIATSASTFGYPTRPPSIRRNLLLIVSGSQDNLTQATSPTHTSTGVVEPNGRRQRASSSSHFQLQQQQQQSPWPPSVEDERNVARYAHGGLTSERRLRELRATAAHAVVLSRAAQSARRAVGQLEKGAGGDNG